MTKVILCGYMASGKTTIAKLLSQAAGLPYIDLDEIIEKEEGKTVAQIFADEGEIKFRKLEHKMLHGLAGVEESFILALGGGTPSYANNYEVLQRDDVVSIYLKTSIDEIVTRIITQENRRPLVANLHGDALHEFVATHLFERSYYYHKAKHIVVTDGKTPEDVVKQIMSLF